MDLRRENMAPELKDVQNSCSWIPTTPAKPDSTTQRPICSDGKEKDIVYANQLDPERYSQFKQDNHTNWFGTGRLLNNLLQETQCLAISTCYDLTNSVNVHRVSNTLQASQHTNSQVHGENLCINDKLSIDNDIWNKLSFGKLLAVAHAVRTPTSVENVVTRTYSAATSGSLATSFHPQINLSFGNLFPANLHNIPGAKSKVELNSLRQMLTGTRVMNAIFLRELEKKEKAGGSSSAPKKQVIPAVTTNTKGNCSTAAKKPDASPTATKKKVGSSSSTQKRVSSPPPQAESPPHSGKKKTSSDPSPSIQQKGKRKLSEISITSASSQEVSGSDDEQPSGPGIHPLYTPESVIVGRGPTHIAQKLLFQLPSHADAVFLNSLGWSDLTRRTCSSLTEGIMYLAELVERIDVLRSNACHDSREGRALRDQLQATIDEAKATHAKELSESQARYDELLEKKKEKEEELQRLIEDHTKEIQKLKEESKISRAEVAQARRDLKDAKAQHVKEASSFKKEFLKSEEFNEICGPKAFHYLEVGFEGAVNLFKAHGYPPTGASTDFISLRDFVASLPPNL